MVEFIPSWTALDFLLPMCVILVVWLNAVYEVRADEVCNSDGQQKGDLVTG